MYQYIFHNHLLFSKTTSCWPQLSNLDLNLSIVIKIHNQTVGIFDYLEMTNWTSQIYYLMYVRVQGCSSVLVPHQAVDLTSHSQNGKPQTETEYDTLRQSLIVPRFKKEARTSGLCLHLITTHFVSLDSVPDISSMWLLFL